MKTKTRLQIIALVSITAGIAFFCGGCQSDGSNLVVTKTPVLVREAQTNFSPVLSTNWVEHSSTQTNAAGEVITRGVVIPEVTTNLQPVILPAIYYTNLALTPLTSNTVQAAGTAATIAGVPFGGAIASGLLGLATLTLGFFNNRNKKRAENEAAGHQETQGALDDALLAARTLVENFETIRQTALKVPGYTPAIDAEVMKAVQTAQQIAGVKSQINDLVDEHTGFTTSEAIKAAA